MKTPRRPTIDDVARHAGVSKSLVSLVVRGDRHVSPERRAAALRAVAELGYRPNAMAQGLVQKRTRIVGVLVSERFGGGLRGAAALLGWLTVSGAATGLGLVTLSGGNPAQSLAGLGT